MQEMKLFPLLEDVDDICLTSLFLICYLAPLRYGFEGLDFDDILQHLFLFFNYLAWVCDTGIADNEFSCAALGYGCTKMRAPGQGREEDLYGKRLADGKLAGIVSRYCGDSPMGNLQEAMN
ncbi:hypothetical protein FNV43_RR00681 [Rhamnella rubrinervis]|uniref:Uncharacterized protein n=1 Tax=Rhamnella rubrinervis TaxID=2594499 RepID=A0A8K0MS90_9ROSA|nr:hypothetical protein FNV43_RR00681 [Rhamnella rubrinervis]